ncbi:MAG: spermidine synthase [Candidatus Eremiobacteraeota bacterium]|nr:spermidine synthase [Candidatus Eremiobacteraeota bacterium]
MHSTFTPKRESRQEGHRARLTNRTSAMPKTENYQWYTEQFAPSELHAHAIEETYFTGRTPFQSVAVVRTPVFGKMLILDGDTQSSQADEKIYHETLVHPAMASVEDRSDVLILGGGEGATLREILRDPSVHRCTMVDIDGQVVELSKKFLSEWSDGAFNDSRARVIIGDALKFIKEDGDRYGVVISDLTEPLPDSPSFPLFNGEVFRDIKARLAPGGVYVLQASTAGFHNMALHAKMVRSLKRFFRNVRSFYTHVPSFDNDWAFIACSDDADVAATNPDRISTYVASLRGENWFYDAETHRRLFALPLYLRRELAKSGEVFS